MHPLSYSRLSTTRCGELRTPHGTTRKVALSHKMAGGNGLDYAFTIEQISTTVQGPCGETVVIPTLPNEAKRFLFAPLNCTSHLLVRHHLLQPIHLVVPPQRLSHTFLHFGGPHLTPSILRLGKQKGHRVWCRCPGQTHQKIVKVLTGKCRCTRWYDLRHSLLEFSIGQLSPWGMRTCLLRCSRNFCHKGLQSIKLRMLLGSSRS